MGMCSVAFYFSHTDHLWSMFSHGKVDDIMIFVIFTNQQKLSYVTKVYYRYHIYYL